jgi:hypothetical protein
VTGAGGRPTDVDREFVSLFMAYDENESWFLDYNIRTFTTDSKGVDKFESGPKDDQGNFSFVGNGFLPSNFKFTINGYQYANGALMTMKKGERVRWYLLAINAVNSHSPHWHGNVVMQGGHQTDVVALLPAQMETVDMVPDDVGTWMYHCHVDDHMDGGMIALYKVEP